MKLKNCSVHHFKQAFKLQFRPLRSKLHHKISKLWQAQDI